MIGYFLTILSVFILFCGGKLLNLLLFQLIEVALHWLISSLLFLYMQISIWYNFPLPWNRFSFSCGADRSTFIRAPGFLGQPAIHWNLHYPCFENLERQSLYNFRVNIWHTPYYFLHLWNLQQRLLLSMRMPSCIYSPYLRPLDEWSITWNWISSRMAWDTLPCLLEKPYRPHLLQVDTSDNCSFGLEVTDIYASDSLERGAQSTDWELKGLFPIFFPVPRE